MPSWTSIEEPSRGPAFDKRGLLEGVSLGAVYGVLLRGYILLTDHWQAQFRSFSQKHSQPSQQYMHHYLANSRNVAVAAEVMTLSFLVLGPVIIGFLTVRRLNTRERAPVWLWIVAPWLAVIGMMVIVSLFAWEGAICVVMALPLTLLFASIGGVVAGLLARFRGKATGATLCVAFLPALLAPAEVRLQAPLQIRTVESQIRIHAPAVVVWQNIERVPAIAPAELRPSWAQRLGFPRPVEATLSHEGVGGVRHASFERGLLFIETVTAWEPQQRLAFTIRADSAHIPPTTLDEHVTIGGRYFDVLDGEYRLEPLADGSTLLHLTSHQRLSTDFNGYAGFWSDAVMQNLQTSILNVIQHRCEHQAHSVATLTLAQHQPAQAPVR